MWRTKCGKSHEPQAGRDVGAPPARRNPGERGMSFGKYDIVQPDHDKEKGAAQGRLPEPEAKQRTNKCQPIQILLSVPKRVCNTN